MILRLILSLWASVILLPSPRYNGWVYATMPGVKFLNILTRCCLTTTFYFCSSFAFQLLLTTISQLLSCSGYFSRVSAENQKSPSPG